MLDYHYALVRYVPDPQRMEPVNVGVILQGQNGIDIRFNPHAAKRKDVDTDAFRQWKQFFTEEINGQAIPLFQPDKASPQFLQYLEGLCDGPILLSTPLKISAPRDRTFHDVLNGLFTRLVLPRDVEPSVEIARPTGQFRKFAEEYRFLQRGMKRYAHVEVPTRGRWTAYRQVLNGEFIAIDKVEAGREIGRTANEIDKLPHVLELLPKFKKAQVEGKHTRYVLLADNLAQPFAEQTSEEFKAMQDDLHCLSQQVQRLGGEVLRTPEEAAAFAEELDHKLPAA